jgi:hypothetical protein
MSPRLSNSPTITYQSQSLPPPPIQDVPKVSKGFTYMSSQSESVNRCRQGEATKLFHLKVASPDITFTVLVRRKQVRSGLLVLVEEVTRRRVGTYRGRRIDYPYSLDLVPEGFGRGQRTPSSGSHWPERTEAVAGEDKHPCLRCKHPAPQGLVAPKS